MGSERLQSGFNRSTLPQRHAKWYHSGGLWAKQTVTHEKTGLVVPPNDPKALAAAIKRFFAEQMGMQLSANIAAEMDRFSWNALVAQLEMMSDEERMAKNE
jgi:hypothetical protein